MTIYSERGTRIKTNEGGILDGTLLAHSRTLPLHTHLAMFELLGAMGTVCVDAHLPTPAPPRLCACLWIHWQTFTYTHTAKDKIKPSSLASFGMRKNICKLSAIYSFSTYTLAHTHIHTHKFAGEMKGRKKEKTEEEEEEEAAAAKDGKQRREGTGI